VDQEGGDGEPADLSRRAAASLLGALGLSTLATACAPGTRQAPAAPAPPQGPLPAPAHRFPGVTGVVGLDAPARAGDVSVVVTPALPPELTGRVWLALGAHTASCEVVQATAIAGAVVSLERPLKHEYAVATRTVLLEDTLVTPQLFGAVADGRTDDTGAIMAAIHATSRVYFPPGTYATRGIGTRGSQTVQLAGARGSTQSGDPRSRLVPCQDCAVDAVITISDTSLSAAPELLRIEHLGIDGEGRAKAGVRLHKAQNVTLDGVLVRGCARGFVVDGTAAGKDGRILEVLLSNCVSAGNSECGYSIEGPAVVAGSFSNVTLNNCASESDGVGCRIRGGGYLYRIESSEFQNSSRAGIEIDSARVSISDSYVETAPNAPSSLSAIHHSDVLLQNSQVMGAAADVSSTIHVMSSYVNALGFLGTSYRLGRTTDSPAWGPPNDLPTKFGAIYPKGLAFTDGYGIEWVCTRPGTNGESAFIARAGRIVRPLTFGDAVDGAVIWFPHEDMVIERISLVVTKTFVGPAGAGLALSSSVRGDVLSASQGAVTNLVAGQVLAASANRSSSARLAPVGAAFLMRGSRPAAPRADRLTLHTDGGWTAGEGLLVIAGYFLALG
jgi:hypothetical protein